jgi:arylsulfatase A
MFLCFHVITITYAKRLGYEERQSEPRETSFRFEARNAEHHGKTIRYEDDEEWDNIGYWYTKNDYVTWELTTYNPGKFSVIIEQSCIKGCGGTYEIKIGSQSLSGTVLETGDWKKFVRSKLGEIKVGKAGEHTLEVKPVQIQGQALMNLRLIILQPIDE